MSASAPDNLPNAHVSLSREGNVEVNKVEAKGLLHLLQWFVLFSSIIYWFCPLPPCSPQLGRKQTEARRSGRDGPLRHSGVGDHAAGAHDLGQVAAWHHSGWLVVDAALEARGAPGPISRIYLRQNKLKHQNIMKYSCGTRKLEKTNKPRAGNNIGSNQHMCVLANPHASHHLGLYPSVDVQNLKTIRYWRSLYTYLFTVTTFSLHSW